MTRREWLTAMGGVSPGLLHAAQQLGPLTAATRRGSYRRQAAGVADPTTLSIAALGAALADGRLTPIDVTAAYLARIAQQDGGLRAFVTVTRDRAYDDTRRVMTSLAAGAQRGPLAAVPVAHKDLFATRGIRTTGGSKLHEQWMPEQDAEVVTRLAAAGTVLVGKTNTHELGGGVTTINPFFGTTHNPRDTARIAGGSSGGSAAAVAARLTLVATGSDTGGSVRIPAAFCGCVGLKPTFGLVSTAGLLGACPTFDHAGVLARTPDDAMRVLAAIAGTTPLVAGRASSGEPPGAGHASSAGPPVAGGTSPGGPPVPERAASGGPPVAGRASSGDSPSVEALADAYRAARARGVRGLRVGVPRAYFFDALDAGVARAVERALTQLRADGALVRDVTLPVTPALYDLMFAPIAVSEIRATYATAWAARPEAFSKDFAAVFGGAAPAAAAVADARDARLVFERAVIAVLAEVDVLAMPTVPQVAPPIDGPINGMRILRNTWPFNAARVPAVSVPCGDGEDALPVGLQLVGRMFEDARLLAVAAAIEL